MTVTEVPVDERVPAERQTDLPSGVSGRPRDLQRTFQLWLAAVWLLDAVLQIQPFMFTPGKSGFSGMIGATASGNPGWIANTITWNASIVDHHPVLTNSSFALVQFLIAFGIIWRRTTKGALVLSVVWAIGVWWFGEGLGGVFSGGATPLGGGPGAALFYAVLAIMLWPSKGPDTPFVAAKALRARTAKMVWVSVWAVLAVLCLVGSGRSPQYLQSLVKASGQPGWLAHLDRFSVSFLLHDGTAAAVVLAVLCCVAAMSVYLPAWFTQFAIVLVVVAFTLIWVAVQNFGGILASGATDPNSALLVVLLALVYWPLTHSARSLASAGGSRLFASSCAIATGPGGVDLASRPATPGEA